MSCSYMQPGLCFFICFFFSLSIRFAPFLRFPYGVRFLLRFMGQSRSALFTIHCSWSLRVTSRLVVHQKVDTSLRRGNWEYDYLFQMDSARLPNLRKHATHKFVINFSFARGRAPVRRPRAQSAAPFMEHIRKESTLKVGGLRVDVGRPQWVASL